MGACGGNAARKLRTAIEGMQCQVSGFTHLRFEIVEGVGDILVSEHQAYDLNKSAAWESKYNRIRHLFLPIRILVSFSRYGTWFRLATAKPNYGTMIHVLQGLYKIDTGRTEAWRLEQSKLLSGRMRRNCPRYRGSSEKGKGTGPGRRRPGSRSRASAVLSRRAGSVVGLGKRQAQVTAPHLLALRNCTAPRSPGIRRSIGFGGTRCGRGFETWL